jgi:Ser/Thr protein kinase RdoA (MazF antagonist)
MFETIFKEFGLNPTASAKPFGSGLINNTWLINDSGNDFILQRINQHVFKKPVDIATNIRLIGDHLERKHPDYLFIKPYKTIAGDDMVLINDHGFFRLFPFIKNSHTVDTVNSPAQAYEAAKQFGRFTNLLSEFPVDNLKITIPDFHNLPLRYSQFESAFKDGNKVRIKEAGATIAFLKGQNEIVGTSEQISNSPYFKIRVTHHDTKISNVLFGNDDHGLCVIDLDTVMPGYFISDFGDMMRTYLSPVSEEEKDISKIEIREEYFKAIAGGYLSEMGTQLTSIEKDHMVYAGKFLTYMQALRFLTDYLHNDVYYGSKYEGHNLIRANNQAALLKQMTEKEKKLEEMI